MLSPDKEGSLLGFPCPGTLLRGEWSSVLAPVLVSVPMPSRLRDTGDGEAKALLGFIGSTSEPGVTGAAPLSPLPHRHRRRRRRRRRRQKMPPLL